MLLGRTLFQIKDQIHRTMVNRFAFLYFLYFNNIMLSYCFKNNLSWRRNRSIFCTLKISTCEYFLVECCGI